MSVQIAAASIDRVARRRVHLWGPTAGSPVSWVRYSYGSTSCRRQVLVRLANMAAVRQPRELPTNNEFLRFKTTRLMSRSLMLLSTGHHLIQAEGIQLCPLA